MGLLKEKAEVFGTWLDEDLQRATTSSILEDVFAAIIFTKGKIQQLVDAGVGTTDKSWSAKAEVKKYRYIAELLLKRYTFLQNRLQKKKDKNNEVKKKKNELHKLVDTDIVSGLIKENAIQKRKIEQLKTAERNDLFLSADSKAGELQDDIKAVMLKYNVDSNAAVRILREERKYSCISADNLVSYVNTSDQLESKDSNDPNESKINSEKQKLETINLGFDEVLNTELMTKNNPVKE